MEDESQWEHRVVRNIVWSRNRGWVIDSALYGEPETQSFETYEINVSLIEMIRASPHNTRTMTSRQNAPQETTQDDSPNESEDEDEDEDEDEVSGGAGDNRLISSSDIGLHFHY